MSGEEPDRMQIPFRRRSSPTRLRILRTLRGSGSFLLLFSLAPVVAQTPSPGARAGSGSFPPPVPGWSFPQRQTLTYAVDWRVFPAGTATVHLQSDGALERITVTGDSQGAINLLFRVSDRFQSTFNRSTGCSESFSRQIMEGRRQVDSDQRFDSAHRVTFYDERNLVSHIDVHQTAAIPPCATDMLSGIFYAGSQTLEPGSVFHLPVVSGNHVRDVTLRAETRETVHTPTTTYHTVRVQPTTDFGTARNRGTLWIWYSDDGRHIPVQMRARLFWGTLTFRLTGIDTK
jgi:hypothetical protein